MNVFQITGKRVTWLPRFFTYNEGLKMSPGETKSQFQAGRISSHHDCAIVITQLFPIPPP